MSATSVLNATEFEVRLEQYLYERSEEWRAVRVGEKEVSEQAEIVRRYADLFTRDQLDALRETEEQESGETRELIYRLRKTCEGGLISAELAEREDELENKLLAARLTFKGEEMPLRNAQAQLAVLPAYADRDELGELQAALSAEFNPDRLELLSATEELAADYSGIADAVERNEEEKAISLRALSEALEQASDTSSAGYDALKTRWFDRLLGEHPEVPTSFHTSYMRRLSPEEARQNAEATTFLEALLFRRYEAKLRYELDFWSRFSSDGGDPGVYEQLLTEATGVRYRADGYLSDMDSGFYSADYLRAWIR